MSIYSIIEEIRSNSSSKFKESIIEKYKDDALFKRVLVATYSPFIQYYVKQLPDVTGRVMFSNGVMSLDEALERLDALSNREITGNSAREYIADMLCSLEPEDGEVLKLILDRNLSCGVSVKTINTVHGNLIGEIPYMRCEKNNEKTRKKIVYPAIAQLKADGTFLNTIKHMKTSTCMTRNGSGFGIPKVNEYMERHIDEDNFVLIGEAVVVRNGKPLSRKESNGLVTSLIKREDTRESMLNKQKEAIATKKQAKFNKLVTELHEKEQEWSETEQDLVLQVWDLVPYSEWVSGIYNEAYSVRLKHVSNMFKDCPFVEIIPTVQVNSYEEALQYAQDMMKQGLEGAVLKNVKGIWENKTSKDQIKLKAELDADLLIIGYDKGEGDFLGGIGSLIGQTLDGDLIVNVGTGLSREQRGLERVDENDFSKGLRPVMDSDEFFEQNYKGKIMAVSYNEAIKSKDRDTYSLFLPVFNEVRIDKTVPDTLKRLLD